LAIESARLSIIALHALVRSVLIFFRTLVLLKSSSATQCDGVVRNPVLPSRSHIVSGIESGDVWLYVDDRSPVKDVDVFDLEDIAPNRDQFHNAETKLVGSAGRSRGKNPVRLFFQKWSHSELCFLSLVKNVEQVDV